MGGVEVRQWRTVREVPAFTTFSACGGECCGGVVHRYTVLFKYLTLNRLVIFFANVGLPSDVVNVLLLALFLGLN